MLAPLAHTVDENFLYAARRYSKEPCLSRTVLPLSPGKKNVVFSYFMAYESKIAAVEQYILIDADRGEEIAMHDLQKVKAGRQPLAADLARRRRGAAGPALEARPE
jgi:hypothetical protein